MSHIFFTPEYFKYFGYVFINPKTIECIECKTQISNICPFVYLGHEEHCSYALLNHDNQYAIIHFASAVIKFEFHPLLNIVIEKFFEYRFGTIESFINLMIIVFSNNDSKFESMVVSNDYMNLLSYIAEDYYYIKLYVSEKKFETVNDALYCLLNTAE